MWRIFNNDLPSSSIQGESVLYADDDTGNVADKNVEELEVKIPRPTEWVEDNRMGCSGLVIGTAQLRQALRVGDHSPIYNIFNVGNCAQVNNTERT